MERNPTPQLDPEDKRRNDHAIRVANRVEQYLSANLMPCSVSAQAYDFARYIQVRVWMPGDGDEELAFRHLPVGRFRSKESVDRLRDVALLWRETGKKGP